MVASLDSPLSRVWSKLFVECNSNYFMPEFRIIGMISSILSYQVKLQSPALLTLTSASRKQVRPYECLNTPWHPPYRLPEKKKEYTRHCQIIVPCQSTRLFSRGWTLLNTTSYRVSHGSRMRQILGKTIRVLSARHGFYPLFGNECRGVYCRKTIILRVVVVLPAWIRGVGRWQERGGKYNTTSTSAAPLLTGGGGCPCRGSVRNRKHGDGG